ncbi:retrotransposon protein, putative, ty1-copia subclass [Tanacetum coccineum]
MVPTKKVDKTPYELWYGKVPNLSYLKVWGCEALVKRDTPDKLEQRSLVLVAKGYTQLYGVDYEETFSPVADIRANRILISIAAYYDYEIWQMDVKTTYLRLTLRSHLYGATLRFVDPKSSQESCKLCKDPLCLNKHQKL